MFANNRQSSYHPLLKLLCVVLCSFAFFDLLLTHPARAVTTITINKNQIEKIADFDLDYKANAGGTITQKYYVFPENKSGHGGTINIIAVNRNTCKKTDTVTTKVDRISGLYNKWGTNYITVIGNGQQIGCYKLASSKLKKASGCPTPPVRQLSYQGTGQGNTATFNGYSYKVAGYKGGKIAVWDKSGKQVVTAIIPKSVVSYEPENISIDGATGEVYINYAHIMSGGKRRSLWYKINASVFAKYTGKNKTSYPTKCRNEKATKSNKPTTTNKPTTNTKPATNTNSNTSNQSTTNTKPANTNSNSNTSNQSTTNTNSNTSGQSPTTTNEEKKSCGGVETILLGCDENGEGSVKHIALAILDIMTIGIGILGVVGIMVVGVQYMTAAGDVTKTTKAKQRMVQIIIGLAVYAVLWTLAQWLLPGGLLQ